METNDLEIPLTKNSNSTINGTMPSNDENLFNHSLSTIMISMAVIILYSSSYLASMAARIAVEKDWIVSLCEDDLSLLSNVNTNVRTLDLVCNISAPFVAGQLLYHLPYSIAGIILICWVSTQAHCLQIN